MSFVGRFICIEKFNPCMSCCPLNQRFPLFGLSTDGGFTAILMHTQALAHYYYMYMYMYCIMLAYCRYVHSTCFMVSLRTFVRGALNLTHILEDAPVHLLVCSPEEVGYICQSCNTKHFNQVQPAESANRYLRTGKTIHTDVIGNVPLILIR